jgi:transcriptional regulator with XRE-family HTH domain
LTKNKKKWRFAKIGGKMATETICDRLRSFRAYKKITQKNMAKLIDCDPSSYSKYENGEREMGINSLISIYLLGCDLHWLIIGEGDMLRKNNSEMPENNPLIMSLLKQAESNSDIALISSKNNNVLIENNSHLIKNNEKLICLLTEQSKNEPQIRSDHNRTTTIKAENVVLNDTKLNLEKISS